MESLDDLAAWRNELAQEESFISKLLARIDQKINRLQVEQMEILSNMNEGNIQNLEKAELNVQKSDREMSEKLDLSVPIFKQDAEEEEDDEDTEETENQDS